MGVQVGGYLLEDLGLVEIQFSLKEQRESGSHLHGAGTGAVAWTGGGGTRESAKPPVRSGGGSEGGIASPGWL